MHIQQCIFPDACSVTCKSNNAYSLVADSKMHVCECTFSYDCTCCLRRSKQGQPASGAVPRELQCQQNMSDVKCNVVESYLSSGWEQLAKRFGDTVTLPWQACGWELVTAIHQRRGLGARVRYHRKLVAGGSNLHGEGGTFTFFLIASLWLGAISPPRDLGTRFMIT